MYAFIFSKIINLKRHLKGVHQWDEMRASSARINFGYRKKRKLLSPSKRKTKPRKYERRQCTFPNCLKEPLRLRNRLRQTHRITDKATIDHYVEQSVVLLDDELVESESESHSSLLSFLSDDENDIIKQMTDRENVASERFFDQESETGDLDWLVEASLGLMANEVIPQRPSSQASFSAMIMRAMIMIFNIFQTMKNMILRT